MNQSAIKIIRHPFAGLPPALQPLVEQLIVLYRKHYGDNLTAIYINGSATRGDWKPGSDIDIIGFTKIQDAQADKSFFKALPDIRKDITSEDIVEIEALTIGEMEFKLNKPKIIYRLMILALDGTCIWGTPYDFSFAVPANPQEFVSRINLTYKNSWLKNTTTRRAYQHPEGLHGWTKRSAKAGVRLAHGIAMLHGAPFEASYAAKLRSIKQFTPELYERACECEALRHKAIFTYDDFELLQKIVGDFIQQSEQLGVIFLSPEEDTQK
ncbi:MAG: nucleotidyltransferase domain-containing protein [Candidatus Saccharimonadales bacterium]